jgi:hypothetical protein
MRALALTLVAGACLSGCAMFPTIEPGTTTEAQIVATYGRPSRTWPEADGTTTLEYATQPMGYSCFMFTIDSAGRVVNVRDALSDTNQARVQIGMTEAEVDHLLGRHREEEFFPRLGETVWDWNVPSYGPGIATRFNVHFKDGRVVRASRDFIYGGGGLSGGGVVFHPTAYLPCPRCIP